MQTVNRQCKKCKINKNIKDFTPNKNCKYGREHECLTCSSSRRVKWEYNNRDKRDDIYLRYKFNISKKDYDIMLKTQNYTCAICNKPETDKDKRNYRPKRLSVDHNHSNNRVRGLLCRGCNAGLGHFKDSFSLLESAIKYLQKHK